MVTGKFRFYDFKEEDLGFRVSYILGPCRSGKSSLGRLLGSLKHWFHVEEHWFMLMSPLMCREGILPREAFLNLWRAAVAEIVYDTVLMRSGSFRPSDHSYMRRMKSDAEIRFSQEELSGRGDVNAYLAAHPVRLVLNLAELGACADLLHEALPGAQLICVERDPSEMAAEIEGKAWFNDENLKKPSNRQLFRRTEIAEQTYYIPFWVDAKDIQTFVSMNDAERAAYYVNAQARLTREALGRTRARPVKVHYDELVEDPEAVISRIDASAEHGEKTQSCLKELKSRSFSKTR